VCTAVAGALLTVVTSLQVQDLKIMIGKQYRDLPMDRITIRMLPQAIIFEKSRNVHNSDMMMVSQLVGGPLQGSSFQVLRL